MFNITQRRTKTEDQHVEMQRAMILRPKVQKAPLTIAAFET